jgi:hypothetical protein
MTKQIHTTANGKTVDMGALRLKNERVRAVGNMSVNARGDVIDDKGNVISSKTRQAQQAYNNQVTKK